MGGAVRDSLLGLPEEEKDWVVGTLFGEQIAIKASEENTKEIETIETRNKPTWLPPQPFLNLGVKTRLIYERLRAKSEI